jgi:cyclopropane-fatty-acyl-phospholipid synthase
MSGGENILQNSPLAPPRQRLARLAFRFASVIRSGAINLVLPDGTHRRIAAPQPGPEATIVLRSLQAIRRLVTGGTVGWAEAYIDGLWDSPDVRTVMALAAENEAEWERMLLGNWWMRTLNRAMHRLRPNSRGGSKRNIMAHYDLGNAFYAEWLDPTMTYSSALFATPGQDLKDAQLAKIHRLCQAIDLRPGMSLLEIGCGWGAFAEIAARDYGAHVVGVTLSPSQLDYARARIARAGLQDRVELRLQDYRDVPESYDRIASIEMFEAVGEPWWPVYFRTLRERLLPGGRAGLQTITICDRLFPTYRRSADFIQRHIFPGGMLPSPSRLREEVAAAGLSWLDEFWFGQDYARTLARWNERFQEVWPRLAASASLTTLPTDQRFKRLWEYYLLYCETGFSAGWTDVGQILLARPD